MGGEIRVIKKDGPGTLMQLYLLLSAPVDETRGYNSLNFAQHNLTASVTSTLPVIYLIYARYYNDTESLNADIACTWRENGSIDYVQVARKIWNAYI